MELVGHDRTKKRLYVATRAAMERNTALPHMMFSGSPGCGKTSMARYLAGRIKAPFMSVVPNDLKDYKSVVRVLDKLDHSNYDGCNVGAKHSLNRILYYTIFVNKILILFIIYHQNA